MEIDMRKCIWLEYYILIVLMICHQVDLSFSKVIKNFHEWHTMNVQSSM